MAPRISKFRQFLEWRVQIHIKKSYNGCFGTGEREESIRVLLIRYECSSEE